MCRGTSMRTVSFKARFEAESSKQIVKWWSGLRSQRSEDRKGMTRNLVRHIKHDCLARKDPEVIRERICRELNKRIEMEVKRGLSTRPMLEGKVFDRNGER